MESNGRLVILGSVVFQHLSKMTEFDRTFRRLVQDAAITPICPPPVKYRQ